MQQKQKKYILLPILSLSLGLLFPHAPTARAYDSANYSLEEDSIDYGSGPSGTVTQSYPPGTLTTISRPELHGAGSQLRTGADTTASYEVESGLLYYDDMPPLWPPQTSTDSNFKYAQQDIGPSELTFYAHVMDDLLPSRTVQNPYAMRSGLNLGAGGGVRIYYKASPGINPGTGDRTGTWGYSLLDGSWIELGDGLVGWVPVGAVEANTDYVVAREACKTHYSCVTESDATLDGVSFKGPGIAEQVNVHLNFVNHTIASVPSTLTRVSGDSVALFKAVDMAGNVAFSGPASPTPWLKTEAGDVHSNRKAIMFNVAPEDNVAYVMSAADSILNFTSSADWVIGTYPGPSFVEALDWTPIPYAGLTAQAQTLPDGTLSGFESTAFESGGIYYRSGDLTIGSGTGYKGVADQGAATIVVDGDLLVTQNFTLAQGGYVAFLVRGNIYVSGTVSSMQGTYLADYDEGDLANSGVINTGDDGSNPTQLVITGQVIARTGFVLNRVFVGNSGVFEPAELVIFDPQVFLNTPPGLKELPGLGAWEEVRPE